MIKKFFKILLFMVVILLVAAIAIFIPMFLGFFVQAAFGGVFAAPIVFGVLLLIETALFITVLDTYY